MGAHGYDFHNRSERDVMIKERKTEDLDGKSIRFEVLTRLLMWAMDDLQFAYLKARPKSLLLESLVYLWYTRPEFSETAFSKREIHILIGVSETFLDLSSAKSFGFERLTFNDKGVRNFTIACTQALLKFPPKEIAKYYVDLQEMYRDYLV